MLYYLGSLYNFLNTIKLVLHELNCHRTVCTQVIYNLNTKIDENENFVDSLRVIHDTENRRVLEDSATQLKRCEDIFAKEKESSIKQLEKLSQALENMREERDQLFEKQVAFCISKPLVDHHDT